MRRITEVECLCSGCAWLGTVADCEPDEDGTLCCPECGREAVVLRTEKERGDRDEQ